MSRQLTISLLALATLLSFQTCLAATENESSFWFMSLTRIHIGENYEAFIDLQPRTSLDPADGRGKGQVQQFLARGAFGYRINDSSTLFQGYAAITNYDPVQTEHRFFQESLSRFSFEDFNYSQRFRFEQRLLDGIEEIGLRVRSFSRFLVPVYANLSIAMNEELFWHVNDAGTGPQAGFDQNRLFLGVNYKINKTLSVDFGYQNQFIGQRSKRDHISNHTIFLGVFTTFNAF